MGSWQFFFILGVVCCLFDVENATHATALEVTAGGRLYNVVVDNDVNGKKLLDHGQLPSRVTFIPLNKIQSQPIDGRTCETAKKLVGKENCHTAISLVSFDDEQLLPAMNYVFGGSFVCRNLEEARKVTFHQNIKRKTVTLDGDVVDPQGTLTGGSRATGASLLVKLSELKQYRNEYEAKERQLKEAEQELRNMEQTSGQYRAVKQRYDVKRHEFELLQQRLQQTTHHRQVQEAEKMTAELEEAEKKAEECKTIITEGKSRIKELEHQVKNADSIREKQLKAAQTELERCKKKAAASQAKWKEHANDADSLKLELEELRKSIETTENQIKGMINTFHSSYIMIRVMQPIHYFSDAETALVRLQEEMVVLEGALDEEQAKTAEMKDQIDEFKERMAAQNLEISNRIAQKEQKEAQVLIHSLCIWVW